MELPLALDEDRLRALCRGWKVSEFSLSGSFPQRGPTLFGLARLEREWEGLFGRKVDLGFREAIDSSENSIRRENILASARVIHAA